MPPTDVVQRWAEATVAVVNADATLRTLMGRTAGLITPWESFTVDSKIPLVVYETILGGAAHSTKSQRLEVSFAVFAGDRAKANAIVERLDVLLRFPAYLTQALEVSRVPGSTRRRWPSADPRQDDPAQSRADLDITFIVPG